MSFKPVSSARTSLSYSSSSSPPVEGKYSPTLTSAMLPATMSIGQVFDRTMDNQPLASSSPPRFDHPKAEKHKLFPCRKDQAPVDAADDSDDDDIDSVVIHRLRQCTIEELSPTPGSQAMLEAFLTGYLPSSQDGPAHLYKDLRKTPHQNPSSLPVPKIHAESSPLGDSQLLPLLPPVVSASPRVKRTLSECVATNPKSNESVFDTFNWLTKKRASSRLHSLPKASNGKNSRSSSDANLDKSPTSNPKKLHSNSMHTFGKKIRPKD